MKSTQQYQSELLNKQLNEYLSPHRACGGGGADASTGIFTDIGLKLALAGSHIFFKSLNNLIDLTQHEPIKIETLDTNSDITELGEIFNTNRSDKAGPNHRYDLVYQEVCTSLSTQPDLSILEVGLGSDNPDIVSNTGRGYYQCGASLYSWAEFFPTARVYGADIDREALITTDRIKCAYVDQLKPDTFDQMHIDLGEPTFDLIVEDGLHSVSASLNTLNYAIKHTRKNGYIILEDLYNPQDIWQTISALLTICFNFQSIRLVNSGGLMLIIEV